VCRPWSLAGQGPGFGRFGGRVNIQAGAQLLDRGGQQLADPRLRDAHGFADLFEIEFFHVIQLHQELLAFGQLGDGLRHRTHEIGMLRAMLAEYSLSDPYGHYYLSSRACKGWK